MDHTISEILNYWFGELDDRSGLHVELPQFKRWFGKNESTDREIRDRFEEDYQRAAQREYADWEKTPEGSLALVILLDQFPRNIYREQPASFATDERALAITLRAIQEGQDNDLSLVGCMFLYMPMMHAESREVQEMSIRYFSLLVDKAMQRSPANVDFFAYSLEYAKKHKAIIDRFGHYPHRNYILDRNSTEEELEFLKGPDSSF